MTSARLIPTPLRDPTRPRPRRHVRAVVLAASAALSMTWLAPPAGATLPTASAVTSRVGSLSGTIVLPAEYGDTAARVRLLAANPSWVAYLIDRGDARRRDLRVLSLATGRVTITRQRSDSAWIAGDDVYVQDYESGAFRVVDPTSGAVTDAGVGTGQIIGSDARGPVILSNPQTETGTAVIGFPATGGRSSVAFPVDGYVQVFGADADSRGALVTWARIGKPDDGRLSYVDFATRRWTTLPGGAEAMMSLSPGRLAWARNGVLRTAPRATPSRVSLVPTDGAEIVGVSAADDALAWVSATRSGPAGDEQRAVWTRRDGAAPVRLSVDADRAVAVGDDDFLVVAGTTTLAAGIYRLTAGSGSLGPRVVAAGTTAPLGIQASAGRYLSQSASRSRTLRQRMVVRSSRGLLTVGSVAVVAPRTSSDMPPVSSGGLTAYRVCGAGSTNCRIDVIDSNGAVVRSIPDRGNDLGNVGLSGAILVATVVDGRVQDWYSRVYDLRTPTTPPIRVPFTTAVWGTTIAYGRPDGSVWLRDVDRLGDPARRVLPPGVPPGASGQVNRMMVQLHGDWLLRSFTTNGADAVGTEALNLVTGVMTPLPVDDEMALGDGVVSYIDAARIVHVRNLRTGRDLTLGATQPATSNRRWLDMTDEFVAFVGSDDRPRLVPLPALMTPDAGPRLVGKSAPTTVSRRSGWRARIESSRPLTAWTLTIRDSRGRVVAVRTGRALDGGARPRWDGRTNRGLRVRAGLYRWTFVARGPGGALTSARGRPTSIGGVLRVR